MIALLGHFFGQEITALQVQDCGRNTGLNPLHLPDIAHTHAHTHVCMHACTHAHTHTHTHNVTGLNEVIIHSCSDVRPSFMASMAV